MGGKKGTNREKKNTIFFDGSTEYYTDSHVSLAPTNNTKGVTRRGFCFEFKPGLY